MRPRSLILGSLALAWTVPLTAQEVRQVNLTGAPVAALDEPLSSLSGLQEVAPGKLVITDPFEQRLLFADFAANTVRDIGRQGEGPGEWRMPMTVLSGPAGVAYVPDIGLRKVHVVDTTAKITRTIPLSAPSSGQGNAGVVSISVPRGSDAQGRLFSTGSAFTPGQTDQPDSIPILRWDPRSNRTDTVTMIANETRVTQSGSSGNMRVMARVGGGPLRASMTWVPLPNGGVAMVHPSPYRVDVISPTGTLTRGTPVPFTPTRVGAAERDAYRKDLAAQPRLSVRVGGGGGASFSSGPTGGNAPQIPDSDFPETMGPFVNVGNPIRVAPNGETWVLRARAANDRTPTYDIFSPTGRLVGKATLRPNSQVVGFGRGVVYVARQDPADDLRYVEQYALR